MRTKTDYTSDLQRSMKGRPMSDLFFSDLTTAIRSVSISRKRALQLIGGAMAVAMPARLPQAAEAGKHHKPPLAFVGATVTDVTPISPLDFRWRLSVAATHPASNKTLDIPNLDIDVVSTWTGDKVRAKIVAELKQQAALGFDLSGDTVPEDRIAVTLI